ncbi:hypothetical protein G6F42_016562 [Rhizopus arrhizus]|nr:hypothetical protein G6F42_016562 [Rhizopus arrhizus]
MATSPSSTSGTIVLLSVTVTFLPIALAFNARPLDPLFDAIFQAPPPLDPLVVVAADAAPLSCFLCFNAYAASRANSSLVLISSAFLMGAGAGEGAAAPNMANNPLFSDILLMVNAMNE